MPQYILHKDGAYQVYSTVVDAPLYDQALTLDELTEVVRSEGGQSAVDALPARLHRAHHAGSSALPPLSLSECIRGNRAGPDESHVPEVEFIARWLTLP